MKVETTWKLQFVHQTKIRKCDDELDEIKDAITENALCQIPWQMAKWMMKNGYTPEKTRTQQDDETQEQVSMHLRK